MDFKIDLAKGEMGEVKVAEFLKQMGFETLRFNKDINYDILAIQRLLKTPWDTELFGQYTFEVKTDEWEFYHNKITNNMFLEISCNGKQSGISASRADFFIYYYPRHKTLYIIRKNELIRNLNSMEWYRHGESGDGGRVIGYLVDRTNPAVYKHFWVYDEDKNGNWIKR
jgi:hypothetical protein